MNRITNKLINSLYNFRYRLKLFVFIFSGFALTLIWSNCLLPIEVLKVNNLFFPIYSILMSMCGFFIILFLPSYPIFFILFGNNDYNFNGLEKLTFSIISNLSFYILVGYFCYFLKLGIDSLTFLIFTSVAYFGILLICVMIKLKKKEILIWKFQEQFSGTIKKAERPSIVQIIKNKTSINVILLTLFTIVLCIFNLIRIEVFLGTDPWLHIFIIKYIDINNTLPLNFYFENLGLHIFGSLLHFFTNLRIILIPRVFVLYSYPIGALILYSIFKKIFRKRNLAILGVFILEFSFLGFSFVLYQFWPTALAVFQCLLIFYLLYSRQEKFLIRETPGKRKFKSGLIFTYVFIIMILFSSILTHSLITLIFIVSYCWVYLIYFIKERERGMDLSVIIIMLLVFSLFFLTNFGVGHLSRILYFGGFSSSKLPIFIFGGVILLTLIIWIIVRSIDFETGKFKKTIMSPFYRKIEKKAVVPLIIIGITISVVIFLIGNIIWFNYKVSSFLVVIQDLIFILFSIWGFVLFQKKPKGKFLFIWLICFLLLLGGSFFHFVIFGGFRFYGRIFLLLSVPIIIGFISYIYKLAMDGSFNKLSWKALLFIIVVFSILTSFIEEQSYYQSFSLNQREINNMQWFSDYNSQKQVIISEFSWEYVFIYYDYPYSDGQKDPFSIHTFITIKEDYIQPGNHITEEGINILQQLKAAHNKSVYLVLTDYYISFSGFESFEGLTEQQIQMYFNLSYLNRICSTKAEGHIDEPIYWVI